jgi:hypothetical protein
MIDALQPRGKLRCSEVRQFLKKLVLSLLASLVLVGFGYCQADTATVSGVISDQLGAVVPNAEVRITNTDTNVAWTGTSNGSGVYLVTGLKPGRYRIHVGKEGFKGIDLIDLILNVQDSVSRNFTLQVGSTSETVSVEGNALQINTQDATVSTVVDRQFAENLPLNGRSFQSLIQLAPGVVVIPSNASDGGQFSVNGQRGESNYWMVDGVSANIGISSGSTSAFVGNGLAGALGSFSALGGTNSLVSVDALQEFRIQTSTFAPEFGRTPGGQISIVTRSGTNQYHGTAFDYLRNDALDANYWFNTAVTPVIPKAQERQNDFGGTFSGPILKERTFFFFSYEGLRLRLPQTELTTVPCDSTCVISGNVRAAAVPAMQPFLNAFPLPSGRDHGDGTADLNASFSNPATLDAYSLRVDHRLNDKLSLFARYDYSPSELDQRGGVALSDIKASRITTQTATLGGTSVFSPTATNDLRFNYSRTNSSTRGVFDNFHGAVPLSSLPFPSPFTSENAQFGILILSLNSNGFAYKIGQIATNLQRQINIVDNVSSQKGSHSLKFGVDFRRLSPLINNFSYGQFAYFLDVPSAEAGNLLFSSVSSSRPAALVFKNLGAYAQDTWRIRPNVTITYGLRWDLDFAPSSNGGPNLLAVTGYNLQDLSNLALAPAGTPPFNTSYGSMAPRLGLAYQVSQSQGWQTVLRGGFGVFYDLATSEAGNAHSSADYPFGALTNNSGGSFPLPPLAIMPPAIVPPSASNRQNLFAFDPHLRLPYTLEWNAALEQSLGKQQSISASYVGSAGRRLLQAAAILSPNPNFAQAILFGNAAASDYTAMQLQYERRMSRGLQVTASYTWSHSIDDGSAGSYYGSNSNSLPGTLNSSANRGPSDFDIRHAFSAALTYDIPAPKVNAFTNAVLRGWSLQSMIQARSGPPVDVSDSFSQLSSNTVQTDIRPDVVPGQPFYLFGSQCVAVFGSPCPGGKGFNPAAFTDPPLDPSTSLPLRQGNVPRNFLRGFGATQWDFAVHRNFPIHESFQLEFRAEMFNVLNHPNFGPPSGSFGSGGFGLSNQMLGQSLNGGSGGNLGGGAFSPLYQLGGPRSMQFGLKLKF